MFGVKIVSYILMVATVTFCINDVNTEDDFEDEIPISPNDLDMSTTHHHYEKDGQHRFDYDHDSVLGSHQETEDFKELEPEEAKRRLGILFEKMDSDNNGNMSKAELTEWIIQSFRQIDAEDAAIKLEEIDGNHDKNVTLNEFLIKSYGHTEKEIEEMLKSNKEWKTFLNRVSNDKDRFHLADSNNDSQLDLNEFIKFHNPEHYKEMAPYVLNRTLTHIDKNNNGVVDLDEFLREENIDNETDSYRKNVFKEHDKNNNEVLDKEEIIEWMTPGFEKSAQIEVEHLYNSTDANKDSQLSKEEVIDQHELWVGSQATDYGRHLDEVKQHEEL